MALAATVNFTFADDKGKSSFCKIRIPSSLTFAEMIGFAQAAGQLLVNASGGYLTSVSVSFALDISAAGFATVASTLSDIAQKAFIVAKGLISGLFARFKIPTLDESKVESGTDLLDTSDADIAALLTAIEDGIDVGGTMIQPVMERNVAITDVSQATELFRKS